MKLIWHGHSCFTLESIEGTIVFDPFEDDSVPGLKSLDLMADVVLCSHQHFDHNAIQNVCLSGKANQFKISSLATFHDDKQGALRGENTVYIIDTEGMKIAHLGDLGDIFSCLEKLKGIDVLLIPVGGHYTIDANQAKEVVDLIQPRIVIPMHYRSAIFGFDVLSTLDKFTDQCDNVVYYKTNEIEIKPDTPAQVAVLNY